MNRFVLFSSALLVAGVSLAMSGCAESLNNPRVVASNVDSLQKAFGGGAAQAGPATAGPAAEPTGWATLKGQFKLSGAAPARNPLPITKDQHICAPGGKPVLDEEIVVDSSGGIKDVAIFLTTKAPKGSDKWEHPDYAASATGEATMAFDQKNCVFLSHVFIMRSTQTVVVKNSDDAGHNTSINPSAGSKAQSFNVLIPANSSTTYKPVGESLVPNPVSCSIHPWMSARILTRNNPYYAVTAPDGTFEIKNVPAGVELEFAVWQEKIGFLGKVSVQENGAAPAATTWKKGRFKKTIAADQTLDLNVTIDSADVPK